MERLSQYSRGWRDTWLLSPLIRLCSAEDKTSLLIYVLHGLSNNTLTDHPRLFSISHHHQRNLVRYIRVILSITSYHLTISVINPIEILLEHLTIELTRPAFTFDLMIDKTKLVMVWSNPIDFSSLGFCQTFNGEISPVRIKLEVFWWNGVK